MKLSALNEQARLAAVRRYDVLDTPPETAFDRLVQMASRMLSTPIALLTLLDEDRQWFKARVGVDQQETPRDIAFCEHNLGNKEVLVVPDLTADPRFANNPTVAEAPHLRFYAGAPLVTPDGFVLGSLCVLDTQPRTLATADVETLQDLAALAMEALERRAVHSYRKDLLESIPSAFVALDTGWRFTYVNKRAEEILRYDRETLMGQKLWSVYPPASVPGFHAALEEAVTSRQTIRYEGYSEPLQGWIRIHAAPFDGGVSVYFDDISAEHEQAAALKQQRNLLEQTQRLAGAWEVDVATGHTLWTDRLFDIFELPSPDVPAFDEALLFYVEPYRTRVAEAMQRCRQEKTPFDLELKIETAKGSERWVRATGGAVAVEEATGGEQGVRRIAGALQDITDRKRMERQLRQREKDLQEVQRIARLGSWTWDLRTGGTTWSETMFDIFGLPPKPTIRYEDFIACVHPADRAAVRSFEAKLRGPTGADRGQIDYRIIRPDGEVRHLRERSELVRAEDGSALRVVGTAQDVTVETQRNAELQRAKEEADQMNRLKSRFLANMSHEIRTPLTSIIGFAEILKQMDLDGPEAECIDTIYRSSDRLFTTLTSVLDLSQLEAGTLALNPSEVVVQDIISDAVSPYERQAAQQGLALECALPPFDVRALVDHSGLMRILTNLVGNAVKFTPEGRVDVTLIATDDTFTLTVADTGIGIDEAFLPQVFDPFLQESNGNTRLYEGNGLGLAITKDLVGLMGGTIDVASQKGEGTTFTLVFPRRIETTEGATRTTARADR